jgi:hypothetical protein
MRGEAGRMLMENPSKMNLGYSPFAISCEQSSNVTRASRVIKWILRDWNWVNGAGKQVIFGRRRRQQMPPSSSLLKSKGIHSR